MAKDKNAPPEKSLQSLTCCHALKASKWEQLHAGTCMLVCGDALWSGLTWRRPGDERHLSVFTLWHSSISFLWRVLLSFLLPFGEDFPGHRAKVKNKTMCTRMTAPQTCTEDPGKPWHVAPPLSPGGHIEMSESLRRRLLMSEHVARVVGPGIAQALSSCARDCWSTGGPPSPPLQAGGRLIVAIIDCRRRSVLSSG